MCAYSSLARFKSIDFLENRLLVFNISLGRPEPISEAQELTPSLIIQSEMYIKVDI